MLFLIIRANKAQNKIQCNTATQLFTDMEGCKCYIYNNGHKQSQQIKMIGCQCYLQLLCFCNLYFLNISTQNELSNTYLKKIQNTEICLTECMPILLIVNYQSSHRLAGKKSQLIELQAQEELDFRSPGSTTAGCSGMLL